MPGGNSRRVSRNLYVSFDAIRSTLNLATGETLSKPHPASECALSDPEHVQFHSRAYTTSDAIYFDTAEVPRPKFHYVIAQMIAFAEDGAVAAARAGDDAAALAWVSTHELKEGAFEISGGLLETLATCDRLISAGMLAPGGGHCNEIAR